MILSIITINFNNKEGLRKTVDSVLSQTWKDFEWIIIDGGSNDGSKELILENQSNFAFWCSEPDKGIYNAMNKGVGKATGDYLLFLNSGDIFYDNSVLERVISAGLDSDIVSGQMVRMDNDQPLRHYHSDIVMQLFNGTLNHQASFIRRELLLKIPYDESLKIVSDWKFWWESIVFHQCSFQVSDLCISKQDMTGISLSDKNKELHLHEREKVLNSFFPPLVLDSFQNYNALRHLSTVKNLAYLKENHPGSYRFIKKIISFASVLFHKFN